MFFQESQLAKSLGSLQISLNHISKRSLSSKQQIRQCASIGEGLNIVIEACDVFSPNNVINGRYPDTIISSVFVLLLIFLALGLSHQQGRESWPSMPPTPWRGWCWRELGQASVVMPERWGRRRGTETTLPPFLAPPPSRVPLFTEKVDKKKHWHEGYPLFSPSRSFQLPRASHSTSSCPLVPCFPAILWFFFPGRSLQGLKAWAVLSAGGGGGGVCCRWL